MRIYHAPCPAIPPPAAYCFQKQCDLIIGSAPIVLRLVDNKTMMPLKKVSVAMVSNQTIYCVRAPCPQPPALTLQLKTNDTGALTLQPSEIAEKNHFTISGYAPKGWCKSYWLR